MQKLAAICIDRPVFASMLILLMVTAGLVGFSHLAVDRYPAMDSPTVSVRTQLPGASPEEVEVTVSYPIEEAVNTVEGLDELRSISGSGSSFVMATFNLNRDIDSAAQDVRDRIAAVLGRLPVDAKPPTISKFDSDSGPVLTLVLAGDRPLRELTELADKRVKRVLERSPGVGEVQINGGLSRTINLWLDSGRMQAYGITVDTVRDAVARQNSDVPGGNITDERSERTLRTMGRVVDPRAFSSLVVATRNGVPIRIEDLGEAEDGTEEVRSTSRLDGVPCVTLDIRRQTGANTVGVIDDLERAIDKLRPTLPGDLRLEVVRDQSRYIRAALHEIEFHLVIGSLLASLVVLFFLRSWRAMVIAGIAIPVSVVTTFGIMWALDFTLNGVTMLALVLMVGVVIDDAIVVLENVQRWADTKGVTPFAAARGAVKEIAMAVLATTLSLVVIFVPVSFMSSVTGRFLFQFGITAAVAVLVSLVVSFSLTPAMCARLVRPQRGEHAQDGLLLRGYRRLLQASLRRPVLVGCLALLVAAATVPLASTVRQDYIPSDVDEGEFDINVSGPDSASVQAMDVVMHRVEDELKQVPAVQTVLTNVGGGFLGGVAQGRCYVRIAPFEERRFSFGRLWHGLLAGDPGAAFRGNYSQRDVMAQIRARLRKLPDVRCSVRNQRSLTIGGGFFDIDFALRGPDLQALADYSMELKQRAEALGSMVDLDTTLRLERPELRVEIDRARAAELGVDTRDIATALRLMVGGDTEVSRFRDPKLDEEYDVRLRLRTSDRDRPERLGELLIGRRGGDSVRLDNLVRFTDAMTPSRIDRLDRQRQASVRGGIAPGHALADQVTALNRIADEMHMPPEYSHVAVGRAKELVNAGREFLFAFLLALALMYMILAAQFESLSLPLVILLALPLSAPFALVSLWAFDQTINLYSALGVLVLFGMVKKNGILQADHARQLLEKGMNPVDAVVQGCCDRLRPILMTTFAFVAGMLPLAVGAGPGAEERKAIAIVVIGGQTLSLLLSLLMTPVALLFVLRRHRRRVPEAGHAVPGNAAPAFAPAEPAP